MSACSVLEFPTRPYKSAKVSVFIESRSDFHFTVPARSDRRHSWRNHFDSDSVGYQVLGRWENLAARNRGFVYEGTANTAKHSAHYRQNDAPTRRTIQLIKKFCRAKGIISDDCWGTNQWGHRVLGFWLVNHAEFCAEKGHQHRYWRPLNDAVRKARFHPWEFVADSPSIRHGFATDSQPIRHGFAADSPSIRGDFAPISPKSGFDFAPSPSSDVAPTSPQGSVKPEDAEKSLCVGIRQNGDLVGGSLLNLLSPVNLLNLENQKNQESRESLVSPANQDLPFYSRPKSVSPSLNSFGDSKPAQEKQVNPAHIALLQSLCYGDTGKTPKVEHIERLLRRYRPASVKWAWVDYVRGLDEKDKPWAEKVFFADEGAVGIILKREQDEWLDTIRGHIARNTLDGYEDCLLAEFLKDPVPVGLYEAPELIREAQKVEGRLIQDYMAKHQKCAQCQKSDIFYEDGKWRCRECIAEREA